MKKLEQRTCELSTFYFIMHSGYIFIFQDELSTLMDVAKLPSIKVMPFIPPAAKDESAVSMLALASVLPNLIFVFSLYQPDR